MLTRNSERGRRREQEEEEKDEEKEEVEDEAAEGEQTENWFSLGSAQRICGKGQWQSTRP